MVGTTREQLTAADNNTRGHTVSFRPLDGDVYVGGEDVTAADGYPVLRMEPYSVDVLDEALYVISEGSVTIALVRIGVA